MAGWKDANDRAVWTLSRVRPGKYDVQATWSLAGSETALQENRLTIEIDGNSVTDQLSGFDGGRVKAPGGWDKFDTFPLGQLDLSAGDHQVTVHPSGPLKGEWIRLRSLKFSPIVQEK
jgi:serine/threonine-protein kinase